MRFLQGGPEPAVSKPAATRPQRPAQAQQPKQRFILPSQWSGVPRGDNRPRKEAVAVQIPTGDVERRSLDVYELVAGGVA